MDKRQGQLIAASSKSSARKTTLMLRHIPNKYTREALLSHIEEFGLQDCIDFIYVPMDFNRMVGLGYAFVNFASSEGAEHARQMFDGFRSWRTTSHKVCEVSFSYPLQGLDAYIEHYRNSCLMHESVPDCCKPALFEAGIRQPFPAPTRQIPVPRVKR
jgi:RNA recognition motif-containing protein